MADKKQIELNQRNLYNNALDNDMFEVKPQSFEDFQKRIQNSKGGYLNMVYNNYKKKGLLAPGTTIGKFRGNYDLRYSDDDSWKNDMMSSAQTISKNAADIADKGVRNISNIQRRKPNNKVELGVNPDKNLWVDPTTGKAITTTGEELDYSTDSDKFAASQHQAAIDKYQKAQQDAIEHGFAPDPVDENDPTLTPTERELRRNKRQADYIEKERRRRYSEVADKYRDAQGGFYGNDEFITNLIEADEEVNAYTQTEKQLKEAEKNLEQIRSVEEGKGAVSRFFQGVGDVLLNADNLRPDGGAINTMGALLTAKDRQEKGIDTKNSATSRARQAMLGAYADAERTQAELDNTDTDAYRWGRMTGESALFMKDFLIGSGAGNALRSTAKGVAANASQKVASALSKKMMKATGRVAADLVYATGLAGTLQAPKTAEQIIENYVGLKNEKGGIVEGENGLEFNEGKSVGESIYQGVGNAIKENFSEMFGEYLPGLKMTGQMFNKIGLNKVSKFLGGISSNKMYQLTNNSLNRMGMSGYFGECAEEEFGIALGALFGLGDKWNDFNLMDEESRKKQYDIWAGMFFSVGFMNAPRIGSGIHATSQYLRYNHKVNNLDEQNQTLMGEKWNEIRENLDNTPNEGLTDAVMNYMSDKSTLTGEEKEAIAKYGLALSRMRGYNIGNINNAQENIDAQDETDVQAEQTQNNAYIEGTNLQGSEIHDAKNDADVQSQKLLNLANSVLQEEGEEQLTEDTLTPDKAETLLGIDDELDVEIYRYIEAQARLQGATDSARLREDDAREQAEREVDRITNLDTGMVQPLTLRSTEEGKQGEEVYLVAGNVKTNEDGTINVAESDKVLLVFNPSNTDKKIESISPEKVAALGVANAAEDVKADAVAVAVGEVKAQNDADINGEVRVGSNYSYIDEQGGTHTVSVVEQDQYGNVAAVVDGKEIITTIDDLQAQRDASDLAKAQASAQDAVQNVQVRQSDVDSAIDTFPFADVTNANGNIQQVEVKNPNEGSEYYYVGNALGKYVIAEVHADGSVTKSRMRKSDVVLGQEQPVEEKRKQLGSRILESMGATIEQEPEAEEVTIPLTIDDARNIAEQELGEQAVNIDDAVSTYAKLKAQELSKKIDAIDADTEMDVASKAIALSNAQEEQKVWEQLAEEQPTNIAEEQNSDVAEEQNSTTTNATEARLAEIEEQKEALIDEMLKNEREWSEKIDDYIDEHYPRMTFKEAILKDATLQQMSNQEKEADSAIQKKYDALLEEEKQLTNDDKKSSVRESTEDESAEEQTQSVVGTDALNMFVPKEVQRDIERIAKALGYNIQWMYTADENGWYDPQTNTIHLSLDSELPYQQLFGHEMTHAIKQSNPDLYEKLLAQAEVLVGGADKLKAFTEAYRQRYINAGHPYFVYEDGAVKFDENGQPVEDMEAYTEEAVADTMGLLMFTPDEMTRVAQSLEPSLLGAIRNAIARFVGMLQGKQSEKLNNALKALNDVYVEAHNRAEKKKEEQELTNNIIAETTGTTENGTSVRYSVSAMMDGAGLECYKVDESGAKIPLTDDKGNVIVKLGGRTFDGKHPIAVEDLEEAPSTWSLLTTLARERGSISEKRIDMLNRKYVDILNSYLVVGLAENGGALNLQDRWLWLGESVFKTIASNSDSQYAKSADITRVCKKNEFIIRAIGQMQLKLGQGITPAQVLELYETTYSKGYQVPCPVCYVFSRYIRHGKFATSLVKNMMRYGDHLPGGKDVWTAERWEQEYQEAIKWENDNMSKVQQARNSLDRIPGIIDELGNELLKKGTTKERKAEIRKIISELDAEYRTALDLDAMSCKKNWIKSFAIEKRKGVWRMREDAAYPKNIELFNECALDLRKVATAKTMFPAIQRLRTSSGPSGGKEVTFESNNEIGEFVAGLGTATPEEAVNYFTLAIKEEDKERKKEYLKKAKESFGKAYVFAQQQSLRGGQRMWSWSDNIETLMPDVAINLMQLELLDGTLQTYSKQLEGVNLVARMGGYVNGSLMAKDNGWKEVSEDEIELDDKGNEVLKDAIEEEISEPTIRGMEMRKRTLAKKGAPVITIEGKKYTLLLDDIIGIDAYGREEPKLDKNGNVVKDKDGNVVMEKKKGLFDLNEELDKAGNIMVGMNDIHVKACMADPRIYFIIPWHSSGMSVHILRQMLSVLGTDLSNFVSTDYQSMQEEHDYLPTMKKGKLVTKVVPQATVDIWESHRMDGKVEEMDGKGNTHIVDYTSGIGTIPSGDGLGGLSAKQLEYRSIRNAILDGTIYSKPEQLEKAQKDIFLSQLMRKLKERNIKSMTTGDMTFVYPYEYWDEESTTLNADNNGKRYAEYCRRLGIRPKFSGNAEITDRVGGEGYFIDSPGYWKLLIDRRMYDTKGNYQDLTPIHSDGFSTELLDPVYNRQNFYISQLADESVASDVAEEVIAKDEKRMGGKLPRVHFGMSEEEAVENYQQSKTDYKFSLRGELGAAKDLAAVAQLDLAKELESKGVDKKKIWQATGWERGIEGKWRNEIPDPISKENISLRGKKTIGDIVEAPELFDSYPQLRDIEVRAEKRKNILGSFIPSDNKMALSPSLIRGGKLTKSGRGVIAHELQHAIQHIEGFAEGGSGQANSMSQAAWDIAQNDPVAYGIARYWTPERVRRYPLGATIGVLEILQKGENDVQKGYLTKALDYLRSITEDDLDALAKRVGKARRALIKGAKYSYDYLAGEVEAINVENRIDNKKRKLVPPSETESVSRDKQIIVINGRAYNNKDGKMYSVRGAYGETELRKVDTLIKSGTYFSGGGLLEEGLKGVIDPSVAVEYDEKIAGVYANNHGNHIVVADVINVDPRKLVENLKGEKVEYFHASPVCKNFSPLNQNSGERELDKETAQATADFIKAVAPSVFTAENVVAYKDSDAIKLITDELDNDGYKWDIVTVRDDECGGLTKRKRLIVRAVKDGELPPMPEKVERKGTWYDAIADLIDELPDGYVRNWQQTRFDKEGVNWREFDEPVFVSGIAGSNGLNRYAKVNESIPAITTKGAEADLIILPGGIVKQATPRVIARFMGVSDDYELPESNTLAHKILGNGIPTAITRHVVMPLLYNVHIGTGENPLLEKEREAKVNEVTEEYSEKIRKAKADLDKWIEQNVKKGKAERFERMKAEEVPDNAHIEKKEMEGKYGWFPANTIYNLPVYYSGFTLASKATEAALRRREKAIDDLYREQIDAMHLASNTHLRYSLKGADKAFADSNKIASAININEGAEDIVNGIQDTLTKSHNKLDSYVDSWVGVLRTKSGEDNALIGFMKLGKAKQDGANYVYPIEDVYKTEEEYKAPRRLGRISTRLERVENEDFFETPEKYAKRMIELADIKPTDRVLEPSAGNGAISNRINANVVSVEPDHELAKQITNGEVYNMTLEEFAPSRKFDKVVMNPPFGVNGEKAAHHLLMAFEHLAKGGRMVAVVPTSMQSDSRINAALEAIAENGGNVVNEETLPENAFRSTSGMHRVGSKIVVIANNGDGKKYSIRVYHGSGADFDKFDHSFMGSGEGAQAYGWGTYLTEVESIGKHYASMMRAGRREDYSITYKGKDVTYNKDFARMSRLVNRFGYDTEKAISASIEDVKKVLLVRKSYIEGSKAKIEAYRKVAKYLAEKPEEVRRKIIDNSKVATLNGGESNQPTTEDKDILDFIDAIDANYRKDAYYALLLSYGYQMTHGTYAENALDGAIEMTIQNSKAWKEEVKELKKELSFYESLDESELEVVDRNGRFLYKVDIPDDNGKNYLDWSEPLSDDEKERIKEKALENVEDVDYNWEGFLNEVVESVENKFADNEHFDITYTIPADEAYTVVDEASYYSLMDDIEVEAEIKDNDEFVYYLYTEDVISEEEKESYDEGEISAEQLLENHEEYVAFRIGKMRREVEDYIRFLADSSWSEVKGYVTRLNFEWISNGEDVVRELEDEFGARGSSELLSSLGYVGIKYPAMFRSGGRKDGKLNYVIFNENDAQIVDKKRFSVRNEQRLKEVFEMARKENARKNNPSTMRTPEEIYNESDKTDADKQTYAESLAREFRTDYHQLYAIVDTDHIGLMPEYYEKKSLAEDRMRWYNRLGWGDYRLVELGDGTDDPNNDKGARYSLRESLPHFDELKDRLTNNVKNRSSLTDDELDKTLQLLGYWNSLAHKGWRWLNDEQIAENTEIYKLKEESLPELADEFVKRGREVGVGGNVLYFRTKFGTQISFHLGSKGDKKEREWVKDLPKIENWDGVFNAFAYGKDDIKEYKERANLYKEAKEIANNNLLQFLEQETKDYYDKYEERRKRWSWYKELTEDQKQALFADYDQHKDYLSAIDDVFGEYGRITIKGKVAKKMEALMPEGIEWDKVNTDIKPTYRKPYNYTPINTTKHYSLRSLNSRLDDDYQQRLKDWKESNHLAPDAVPMEKPVRTPQQSMNDYMVEMVKYNANKRLWETAPLDPQTKEGKVWEKLSKILKVKRFSKNTVKAITALCDDLLTLGWGNGITQGSVKRLLSAAKNATGEENVKDYIDKVLTILAENHAKNLAKMVVKVESIKPSKTTNGVVKQGSVDAETQKVLNAFKDSSDLTDEALEEAIETTQDNADRIGYELQRDYRHTISAAKSALAQMENERKQFLTEIGLDGKERARLSELRTKGAQSKDSEGNAIGRTDEEEAEYKALWKKTRRTDAQKQMLQAIEDGILDAKLDVVKAYQDWLSSVIPMIKEGVEGAKNFRAAEQAHKEEIWHDANKDMQGRSRNIKTDKNGNELRDGKETLAEKFVNNPIMRFLLKPMATFEQFMKLFGSKSLNGEGFLYNRFVRGYMNASNSEYQHLSEDKKRLDDKAKELFGVDKWSELYKLKWSGDKRVTIPIWEKKNGTPTQVYVELTPGEALYIYMVNKMQDGKMKLRKMGITESDCAALEDTLDPRLVSLADWIQSEYLPSLRTRFNEVHEQLFGMPMSKVDDYFPLKIDSSARGEKIDLSTEEVDGALMTTETGAIIKRTKNTLPIQLLGSNALSIVIEHIEQMENWAAFAPLRKDLNTLLNYRTFQNKVKEIISPTYGTGKELWKEFERTARIASGMYKPEGRQAIDKIAVNIGKGITSGAIAFRFYTAFKQILSYPAFMNDAKLHKFLWHMPINPLSAYKDWNWAMQNLPSLKKRWQSRKVGDTRLMDTPDDWKVWGTDTMQKISYYAMIANGFVDSITCAAGARLVYDTKLADYKKLYTPMEAERRALQDAEIAFNLTQQSSEGAFVSAIQRDRTLDSVALSVFRNASFAYTRQFVDACRNLKRLVNEQNRQKITETTIRQLVEQGVDEPTARKYVEEKIKGEVWKNLSKAALMGIVVNVAWELGASLGYLLAGDDDDKKKVMIEDATIKGTLGGAVGGLTGGSIANTMIGAMVQHDGLHPENIKDNMLTTYPTLSELQTATNLIGKKDYWAFANQMFSIAAQTWVGVKPQTFLDLWNASVDFAENEKDWQLLMFRLSNAPVATSDNLLFDEIESEKQAHDIYDRVARRYADFKARKTMGVTFAIASEEDKEKVIERYEKYFDKKMKEFYKTKSDEDLSEIYNESKSPRQKKAITDAVNARMKDEGVENPSPDTSKAEGGELIYRESRTLEDYANDVKIKTLTEKVGDSDYMRSLSEEYDLIRGEGTKARKEAYLQNHPDFAAYKQLSRQRKQIKELKARLESEDNPAKTMSEIRQIKKSMLATLEELKKKGN